MGPTLPAGQPSTELRTRAYRQSQRRQRAAWRRSRTSLPCMPHAAGLAAQASRPACRCTAQVKALCALPSGGVPATYLNSHQTKEQRTCVLRELAKAAPTCKLLYVTPEQLAASGALKDILSRLTMRGLVSLFVVDEVRRRCAASEPSTPAPAQGCRLQPCAHPHAVPRCYRRQHRCQLHGSMSAACPPRTCAPAERASPHPRAW